ncbi:hypothetical protein BH09PSE2_BH09PSE2_03860 [soil metagenome]
MDLAPTIILFLIASATVAFAGWRGAHPFDPRRGPRMAPWRLIMVTAAFVALVLLVHLANLLGVKTGRQ